MSSKKRVKIVFKASFNFKKFLYTIHKGEIDEK